MRPPRSTRSSSLLALSALISAALAACGGGPAQTAAVGPTGPTGPATSSLAITAVAPGRGPAAGATDVVIDGTGFTGIIRVRFGGLESPQVTVESDRRLRARSPAHAAGAVDVEVDDGAGRSDVEPGAFQYDDAPVLASLEPGHLPREGGAVILRGARFAAGARVLFGGVPAAGDAQWISEGQLVATAPAHEPGDVDVVVENPDGQRSTLPAAFHYDADLPPPPPPPAAPILAGVTPDAGPETGGTVVILSGASFDPAATATFDGSPATVTASAPTSLTVVAPPHAPGPVEVAVANPGGQRSARAAAFTYVAVPAPGPSIASVSPDGGPSAGGTTVTIAGARFDPAATVAIGGAAALVISSAADALVVSAPAHAAGAADVVVTNPDGQAATAAGAFTYVAPPPPVTLAAVAPASGPIAGGTAITITGTAFAPGATVTVGGAAATVLSVAAGTIAATTPAHAAGVVAVTVTNPDGRAATLPAAFAFVAPAPPALTALAPTAGPDAGGTSVTLTGDAFAAGATVTFDGLPATVTARGATALTVTAPAHAPGAVDVAVRNPDGQLAVLPGGYAYLPPPVVSSVDPLGGPTTGGNDVTIAGAGFLGASVTIGGAAAQVRSAGSSALVVVAPAHAAGAADVVVTNADGRSATLAGAYTFVAPPPALSITSIGPASGPDAGGTAVTISGSAFQAGAAVAFGGTQATVSSLTATTIVAVTPAHLAGAVAVTVTNPDGQSAAQAAGFTFVAPPPPPVLASVLPASGTTAGGTAVALSGAGFQTGATVTFGGVAAAVVSVGATAIAVTTPAHAAGAVDVVVTNPGGLATTLPAAFTYAAPPPPPPSLSGLSPVSGPTAGGTSVTLAGGAFQAGATVTFGGAAAAVGAVTATTIAVTTPAHAAGAVDVVVTNPGGQSATLAGAYAYLAPPPPPALAAVSPASGPTAGGTSVTLSGAAFQAGATVTFGGGAAAVGAVTATGITVTTPAHAAGPVDVVVTNPDAQASTLAGAFTYVAPPPPPVLASATPAAGPAAGGTAVVLAGSAFAAGATVTFGGAAATVTGLTATAISVTTPAHAAGAVDVVVTNPGGLSSTLAGGFTYAAPPPPPAITSLTPNTGPLAGGTPFVVGGTGFLAGATVSVGGAPATVTSLSATAIAAAAPPGAAGVADVTVTNPDGQAVSAVGGWLYADPPPAGPPPTITAVSPTSGFVIGGTSVSITGKDFDAPDVLFDGVPATVVSSSKTLLVVSTPPHASGPVGVTVVNADGASATRANGFRYVPLPVLPAPTITAVTPSSGSVDGNASVVVTGANFAGGATVTFGGVAAFVTAEGPTSLTVLTPPGAPGAADVVVANVDRQSATLVGGYTYVAPPPVVTGVGARGSPQAGGDRQLFVGSGLQNTVDVTFGGVPATGLTYDPVFGNLTVTIPPSPLGPAADGFVDILLVNRDGQSTTWPGFHYGNPPRPAAFTPTEAPRDAEVVITGVDFTADTTGPRTGLTVSFGGNPAVVVSKTATQLTVLVPKMNPGQYKIGVTNFDGQVGVAPGFFIAPGP